MVMEVISYKASDGTLFDSKNAAYDYEATIIAKNEIKDFVERYHMSRMDKYELVQIMYTYRYELQNIFRDIS